MPSVSSLGLQLSPIALSPITSNMFVIGEIMIPFTKDVFILIPRTCVNVTLHSKGELRLKMELRLLIS